MADYDYFVRFYSSDEVGIGSLRQPLSDGLTAHGIENEFADFDA